MGDPGTPPLKLYRASFGSVAIFDPSKHSADYATVANTGTAGGNWTINRSATGFKAAIVNRPLLQFGGAQYMMAPTLTDGPSTRNSTVLYAIRTFGTLPASAQGAILSTAYWSGYYIYKKASGTISSNLYSGPEGDAVDGVNDLLATGQVVNGAIATATQFRSVYGKVDYLNDRIGDYPIWSVGESIDIGITYGDPEYIDSGDWEFISAAIFDRALTDAEAAQAGMEMLARPDERYIRQSGGTMTGPLTLPGDPTANLHAAPKQYVDTKMTTHEAAADPHPGYLTAAEANAAYAPISTAAGHVIQDEGTARTARAALNFIGAAISATDNSGSNRTDVTVTTPNIIVLGPSDPVPGGTPAGTIIIRTE